jgi:hypothetical protein
MQSRENYISVVGKDGIEYLVEKKLTTITEPVFSENFPITINDKGMRDFIQENFFDTAGEGQHIEDKELETFKQYLEASIGDWIMDNWKDYMNNRGD